MKYYAVKCTDSEHIVTSWSECERLTHGVKGTLFKSFGTKEEAKAWLSGVSEKFPEGLRLFVDGSFSPDFDYAGWAFVAVENGVELASAYGITPQPAESRNIDGELMAAYKAMQWLKANNRTGVICHDYEGIARWAKGEWKAKSPVALRYIEDIKGLVGNANFEKVDAHTGVKWNEHVDELAKKAIAEAKKAKNLQAKASPSLKNIELDLGLL